MMKETAFQSVLISCAGRQGRYDRQKWLDTGAVNTIACGFYMLGVIPHLKANVDPIAFHLADLSSQCITFRSALSDISEMIDCMHQAEVETFIGKKQ